MDNSNEPIVNDTKNHWFRINNDMVDNSLLVTAGGQNNVLTLIHF